MVLKNTLFSKAVGVVTLYAFTSAVLPTPAHAGRGLDPLSFNEMYSLAESGKVEALRASVYRGLDIDALNSDNDTGLCVAARRHDVYTYNAFRAAGANPRHPCTQKINGYETFLEKSNVVGLNGNSREALSAMGNKEEYKVGSKIWWWLGGAVVAGGVLWAVLAHNHHHKSKGDDNSGSSSGDNTEQYYSLGANAHSKGGAIKETTENLVNSTVEKYSNTALPNVDNVDLRKDVLNYTNQIKSILYATKGGSYSNKKDVLLDAGVGTIAMNAVNKGSIDNNGYIRIDSYNASLGMVASESSQAVNHGSGIIANAPDANGINMNFSGYTNNAAVVGMYADTNSTLVNYGDIYGVATKAAKETENKDGSSTQITSSTGALIGMEAMILNIGSDLKSNTVTAINSEDGKIYLSAGDSGTTETVVSVEIVGMGSYLDNAFLNGSNILSRTEKVNLQNLGTINLGYSGNYTTSSSTALRKGLGGVIGMRADANTEATNNGDINIVLYDEYQNDGVDVAAGMQSIHGSNLINGGNINIFSPSENKRINYGMLAVEGSGTNSSLYANINPQLTNTEDGEVNIRVSNSFGMATFIGGSLTNEGRIVIGDKPQTIGSDTRFNKNIAMYGYGKTKQAELKNTGTIDIYSYKSIAMQNDYAGGTDIVNDGDINIYESAVDSYVFGGSYSNLYNNKNIYYYATSSIQENAAKAGEMYNPFKNYQVSIGTSIISTKARSIKEDNITYNSSTTEGIYNNKGALINMVGSSFVSAMSVEKNDDADNTQAKAYNYGTIDIEDTNSKNAINAVGMYVAAGSLNNAGVFNEGEIITESRFSAAMASDSQKNANVINNGKITTKKDSSLGIYISDSSNVLNNGEIIIKDNESVGIQAGKNSAKAAGSSYVYPNILNNQEGIITVGSADKFVSNSYGIFTDNTGYNSQMAAQIDNSGTIKIYTRDAGAGIYSLGNNVKIENKQIIDVFGDSAYGIYSGGKARIINQENAIINIGAGDEVYQSYAVYNTGDGSVDNKGIIYFNNKDEGYAIYSTGKADIINEGKIILKKPKSTAIYAEHGTVTNKKSVKSYEETGEIDGNINLKNDYNTAVELSADAKFINDLEGIINVGSADNSISHGNAIKTTDATSVDITNKGVINLYNNEDSHAILASGTVKITNADSGEIYSYNDDSVAIQASGTTTFTNNGIVTVKGANAFAVKSTGESSVLTAENNKDIIIGESGYTNNTGAAIYASKINSVTNSGNITVYNRSGYGIYAESGTSQNKIINNNTITMEGSRSSAIYGGAVATITNNGSIKTMGEISKGIEIFRESGTVAQTINNNSTIIIENGNDSYGIYAPTPVTVNNNRNSSISVGREVDGSNGYGIYAPSSTAITNNGDIDIYSASGKAISGSGTITNTGNIVTHSGYGDSFGIYAPNNAKIQNSGNIGIVRGVGISTEGTVVNLASGKISIGSSAEDISVAVQNASSLDNYGEISVSSGRAAIYNVDTVTVRKDAVIVNTSGPAIYNASKITNYGTIESFNADAISDSGGSLTLENKGYIIVKGNTDAGKDHGNGITHSGDLTLTNDGSISVYGPRYGIYAIVPSSTTKVSIVNNGDITTGIGGTGIYVEKKYDFVPLYDESGAFLRYEPRDDSTRVTEGSASYKYMCANGECKCNNGICVLPSGVSGASVDDPAEPVYASDEETSPSSLIGTNDRSVLRSVRLVNRGSITTSGDVDFGTQNEDDAQIFIGDGGSYQANSFTGTIRADTDIVEGGFDDTYVNEDSFVGENKGVEVISQSYMFDAATQENQKGNIDVVMTLKPFANVVDDENLSAYLSQAYKNKAGEDIFNVLKSAGDKNTFTDYLYKELGFGIIPNLIKQSFDEERIVSTQVNDNLLEATDQKTRHVADLTLYNNKAQTKETTTGYKSKTVAAHGFIDTEVNDNMRSGFGLQLARSESDYNDDSSRYNNTAAVFIPVIFSKNNLSGLIKPKAGLSRGHYRRTAVYDVHKADTKEYFFGADIAAKQRVGLGIMDIEPEIGMNLTELYFDDINESNSGLKVKSEKTLSALSFVGVDIKKKIGINSKSGVVLAAGAKYFHEFGERYKNHAKIGDTAEYYDISSNRFKRDFGLLKFKASYDYEQMSIDASIFAPLQDKYKPYYMLNAKYLF